jgi:hypothetical protein
MDASCFGYATWDDLDADERMDLLRQLAESHGLL